MKDLDDGTRQSAFAGLAPLAAASPPETFGAALVLATGFPVQYRVLRAVSELFRTVIVAGTGSARLLGRSRFCHRYHDLSPGGFDGAGAVQRINDLSARHGVAMILPADAATTRFVAAHREGLAPGCFPTPGPAEFDCLNNKWSFYRLCLDLGLPTPETRYFETLDDLTAFLGQHPAALPGVVKPLDLYGSLGVRVVQALSDLDGLDYRPVLYQAFVDGQDLDISVIARAGQVEKYCVYRKAAGRCHYVDNAALLGHVERIVGQLALSGVLNFGSRIDPAGRVFLTECNPRFWHTMDFAQVCGMNFAAEALRPTLAGRNPLAGRDVGGLRAIVAGGLRGKKPSDTDQRMLRHAILDPLPRLLGRDRFA
ncbi:MAG: ATP-grasp domain-containing protein [Paracoccaceae bacterium]|nr:ATP-grasp domain-containing protein [Paracoccaceae bacterium]